MSDSKQQLWTTTPPNETGWWWHRSTPEHEPVVMEVRDVGGLMRARVAFSGWLYVSDIIGQWQGPLVPQEGEGCRG